MTTIPPEYLNQIVTGDARELAQRIPDESVDLIFTDPIYDRIDDYRWLSETAKRVLKPDSAALVWFDEPNFDQCYRALTDDLSFAAFMHWQRYGHMAPSRSGITVISPCLWLEKGRSKTYHRIANWIGTLATGGQSLSNHIWSKPESLITKWLYAFTQPDHIVADFYSGSGIVPMACKMLGRNYIAFEIDPDTAEKARERVRNTNPPLPHINEARQDEMEFGGS